MSEPVNEPMDAETRDGYRCDELYKAKVKLSLIERGDVTKSTNLDQRTGAAEGAFTIIDVEPGDTFYPTPDLLLGALISSVYVGKVRQASDKE